MENDKSIKDQVHELVDLKLEALNEAYFKYVMEVRAEKSNPVAFRSFMMRQIAGIWVAIDRITESIETISQKEALKSPIHQILPKLNEGEMWDEAPKTAIDWLSQARKAGCTWGHSALKQNKRWGDEDYRLLSDVVLYFNHWGDTTEGHGYWDDIHNTLTQAGY
jgi:hypothetical protein